MAVASSSVKRCARSVWKSRSSKRSTPSDEPGALAAPAGDLCGRRSAMSVRAENDHVQILTAFANNASPHS
jgi:hypothetical protein